MFIELLILLLSIVTFRHYYLKYQLPPGPFSIPLIGTIGILGRISGGGICNVKWHKYQKMYTVFIGRMVIVVINDFKLTKELFAKEEFSGRITSYKWTHIKGYNGKKRGIVVTDGPEWVHQRRFALKELRDLGFGRRSLDSVMIEEVDDAIERMLKFKDGIVHMRGNFNAAIINVLWHIVASKRYDPDAEDTKEMMDKMTKIFAAGFSFRNFFPDSLGQFLPYDDNDRNTIEMKEMMKGLIEEHLADIDYENPRDFIDVYLNQMKANPETFNYEQLIVTILDFFLAGTETTATTLLWAMMYMALNPKVQEKCYCEIQDIIGERSPSTNDSPNMVYTMATIMEIQRVSLVAEASLLHKLTSNTIVEDFKFKEGTFFLANLTKFMTDSNEFQAPHQFNPERFIDSNGRLIKKEMFAPFGIGKRICMAESFAKVELFIFFTRIIQKLKISKTSYELDPKQCFSGVTRIPKPFYVKVEDRRQL